MAKRVLNRRELRRNADAAEQLEKPAEPEAEAPEKATKKPAKAKAAGEPKVKKTRKKKEPPRLFARWGVFDAGMKQIAVFDYNQRNLAEQKIADLMSKKKSVYFLQIVKEPRMEPAPEEVAAAK